VWVKKVFTQGNIETVYFLQASKKTVTRQNGIGQNGIEQNGTDKMVQIKW